MNRRTFLSDISFTIAASCAGCLAACSKSDGGTTGGGTTRPPSQVNFQVNLNNELLSVGDAIVRSGVIVVRLEATNDESSFTAVQANCTHQGTIIGFNTGQGIFICPNHGSRFSTTGSVIMGPATTNLKRYTIDVDGTDMTITG